MQIDTSFRLSLSAYPPSRDWKRGFPVRLRWTSPRRGKEGSNGRSDPANEGQGPGAEGQEGDGQGKPGRRQGPQLGKETHPLAGFRTAGEVGNEGRTTKGGSSCHCFGFL